MRWMGLPLLNSPIPSSLLSIAFPSSSSSTAAVTFSGDSRKCDSARTNSGDRSVSVLPVSRRLGIATAYLHRSKLFLFLLCECCALISALCFFDFSFRSICFFSFGNFVAISILFLSRRLISKENRMMTNLLKILITQFRLSSVPIFLLLFHLLFGCHRRHCEWILEEFSC